MKRRSTRTFLPTPNGQKGTPPRKEGRKACKRESARAGVEEDRIPAVLVRDVWQS